ncbi:MAG: radical SAM protein [Candidatus Omnitrophota bacterium]
MQAGKDRLKTFFKDYSKTHGIIQTLGSICRNLSARSISEDYLIIKGLFNGARAFRGPKFVQIDLTDDCNNSCLCCWCNSSLKKEKSSQRDYLDYSALIKIIDELKQMGTREITLSGGGEPFMYPQLLDVVAYIKKKGINCQLYTNFTLATKESLRRLADLGLDRLIVSLWAADSKVYSLLHPGKDEQCFEEIKDNLAFFSEIKNKRQLVRVHNVINSINYHQLGKIADFACTVKADEVSFTVVDVIPSQTDALLLNEEQKEQVVQDYAKLTQNIKFAELDEFKRRILTKGSCKGEYDKDMVNTIPCYLGWLFARIRANGFVNPCLKSHQISVGNIYKQSFHEIWNSSLQQEFRNKTRSYSKADPYFYKVGNGCNSSSGCARMCDDLTRNIVLHRKLNIMPTSKLLFKMAKLEKTFLRIRHKLANFIRIAYLAWVVVTYSLMLKVYRLIKNISIFPGE